MAEKNAPQTESDQSHGLNIRLTAADNSDQPVLANFTRLNGARGIVFVDFGFLEPASLAALSRLARSGGRIPETLTGKLAVRVALGYDTLAALHQQLSQAMAEISGQRSEKTAPTVEKKPPVVEKSPPSKKDTKH